MATTPGLVRSSDQLERYAGLYWDAREEILVRLEVRNDSLAIAGARTGLTPLAENRFRAATGGLFEFSTLPDGTLQLETNIPGNGRLVYRRMSAPRTPISD